MKDLTKNLITEMIYWWLMFFVTKNGVIYLVYPDRAALISGSCCMGPPWYKTHWNTRHSPDREWNWSNTVSLIGWTYNWKYWQIPRLLKNFSSHFPEWLSYEAMTWPKHLQSLDFCSRKVRIPNLCHKNDTLWAGKHRMPVSKCENYSNYSELAPNHWCQTKDPV